MIRLLLIALVLLGSLSGCKKEKEIKKSGKVVKIGVLAPLSQENSRYGIQSLAGVRFANKEHRFLKNGDEVVFEIIDTNSSKEGTQRAFKRLVDKNVTAIISFAGSDNTLGLKENLSKSHIPVIASLATNNQISRLSQNIVQVCMSNKDESLVAAHFVKDEKFIKRVGVVYNANNAYSKALAKEFTHYYKKLYGEVAFSLDLSKKGALEALGEEDLSQIKMIFYTAGVKDSIAVLKILKSKANATMLASDGLLSSAKENIKDDVNLLNGIYIVEHYASDVKGSSTYKRLQRVLKKDAIEDSSYAFLAYDSYELLYDVLNSCPSDKEQCMRALLHNSDVVRGIASNFSMIDGAVQREIYIDKVENLRLKKVIITY